MSNSLSIVIVEKEGTLRDMKIKYNGPVEEELYKKAGFKSKDGFECRHTWKNIQCRNAETGTMDTYDAISLYSKLKGNAGRENKYDLPPPMDIPLFFGNMVLVRYESDGKTPVYFTKEQWVSIYNHLFGGFEDLNGDDEEEEEEEEEIDPSKLDKNGYEKDGFVVSDEEEDPDEESADDDDDEEDLEYDSELSEEEYFE